MPRTPNHRAVATKASRAALWEMASQLGELTLLLDSRTACMSLRSKLYADRAAIRRNNLSLTGVESSPYDGFTFEFGPSPEPPKWAFTISANDSIEFEIVVPEDYPEEELNRLRFDWADVPQVSLEEAEQHFESAMDEMLADGPNFYRAS